MKPTTFEMVLIRIYGILKELIESMLKQIWLSCMNFFPNLNSKLNWISQAFKYWYSPNYKIVFIYFICNPFELIEFWFSIIQRIKARIFFSKSAAMLRFPLEFFFSLNIHYLKFQITEKCNLFNTFVLMDSRTKTNRDAKG